MYGMLRSSGFLFNLHLWLNPLPVVIGMFIDGLLHSRREKHHDPASIRELVNGHPDIVLQVVFVTGVLVYVFAFAHTDVVS